MNITILTYGSRGDVQPFLALAVALQKRGHRVCLAAPARFSTLDGQHAVQFAPLAGDPAEISKRINAAGNNVYRMIQSMQAYVLGVAPQVVQQMIDACAGADLLVHSFLFTTGGHSLARQLNIPDLSVQTFPMFAPTGAFPSVGFPTLGWAGNYFSHWLATQVFWYGGNGGFKSIQNQLPASFPSRLSWPFRGPNPRPLLFAFSPQVIPRPVEWPAHVHETGYFFLDEGQVQPPQELAHFLLSGPPPICVTFGSMLNAQAERIRQMIVMALYERGERAIFLTGWESHQPAAEDGDVLYLESASHAWLLPQCKAILHHGGAGTTAAGLRAGIPSLVIPHAADQPFWGGRVHALGAGPVPIPVWKMNDARLIRGLEEMDEPSMINAAQAIGQKIRAEKGLEVAIGLIEQEKARFP